MKEYMPYSHTIHYSQFKKRARVTELITYNYIYKIIYKIFKKYILHGVGKNGLSIFLVMCMNNVEVMHDI